MMLKLLQPIRRGETLSHLAESSEPEAATDSGQHRWDAATEITTSTRCSLGNNDNLRRLPPFLQSAKHTRYRKPNLLGTEKEECEHDAGPHPRGRDWVLHLMVIVVVEMFWIFSEPFIYECYWSKINWHFIVQIVKITYVVHVMKKNVQITKQSFQQVQCPSRNWIRIGSNTYCYH